MDVAVLDEVAGEDARTVGTARFQGPSIRVRDLIAARVELFLEEKREQVGIEGGGRGWGGLLTREGDDPARAPAERMRSHAEEAFVRGRYLLLLDAGQAEDLDDLVDLEATTRATFLLLTPLKGG